MTATYDCIATTTLGSAQSSVTFSSISGSYTDLVLVCNGGVSSSTADAKVQFNGDTGNNYSFTKLAGSGTNALSNRDTNVDGISLEWYGYLDTTMNWNAITHIMNYSNSTTNKTLLARGNNAGNGVNANVGLWRNTSAITSMRIFPTGGLSFSTGSTFTLYGIASA